MKTTCENCHCTLELWKVLSSEYKNANYKKLCDNCNKVNDIKLIELFYDHVNWSLKTFGVDKTSIACLNHMEKEVQEAKQSPHDIMEYVDIALLLFDALARVGFTYDDFKKAIERKIYINKNRKWNVSTNKDTPSFHEKN